MIKKLLFVFTLLICATQYTIAQISYSPMDSLYGNEEVTTAFDEVNLTGYLTNDSTETLDINWRIISIDASTPSEWTLTLCDKLTCPAIYSGYSQGYSLDADSNSVMKFGIIPNLTSGSTEVKVQASVIGVPSATLNLTYKLDITANPDTTTAVYTVSKEDFFIFPNPAQTIINIEGVNNPNDISQIEMYNVIGKKVKELSYSNTVDVQDLENGFYLLKLLDSKTNTYYTQTFIKK
ncbi:MAG: T9SS type A sorting domain-containing protein [Chitinophagales bacterium]